MDLLTHSVLGAAAGIALSRPGAFRLAAATGALAALLPDADVLIRSREDPLLFLQFHRQFSHSLLAVPAGALLAALLARLVEGLRKRSPKISFARLYLCAAGGYASAVLLDACTSYGTQLLWPFFEARISWRLIAVVDPVFTLGMVALLLLGRFRKRGAASARRWATGAIGFAAFYLGIGFVQQQRAAEAQAGLARSRGHGEITEALVKPTLGNLVLWRGIYRHRGRWHADGFRPGLGPSSARVYEGESVEAVTADELVQAWNLPPESMAAGDLVRFQTYSEGFLARRAGEQFALGDVRHAMLPTSMAPLWGVVVDPEFPEKRARFATWREADRETRAELLRMLRGG